MSEPITGPGSDLHQLLTNAVSDMCDAGVIPGAWVDGRGDWWIPDFVSRAIGKAAAEAAMEHTAAQGPNTPNRDQAPTKEVWDEEFRRKQGGMGFLQVYAAVTWIRTWLAFNKVDYGESQVMGAHRVIWTVKHKTKPPFYITFDLTSPGHLLYSIDKENWKGVDMTYHPADQDPISINNWYNLIRRITRLREDS